MRNIIKMSANFNFIHKYIKQYILELAYRYLFLISLLIRVRVITINNKRRYKVKSTIEKLQKIIQNLGNQQPLSFESIFYMYILSMLVFAFSDENLKEQTKSLFEYVFNSYSHNLPLNSDILKLLKHIKIFWFDRFFSSIKSFYKMRKILNKFKEIRSPPEIIMFYDSEKYKEYLEDLDINPLILLILLIVIMIYFLFF